MNTVDTPGSESVTAAVQETTARPVAGRKATKPKAAKTAAARKASKPKAAAVTTAKATKPKATTAATAKATKPKATAAATAKATKPKATTAATAKATKPKATAAATAKATKPKATTAATAKATKPKATAAATAKATKPKATTAATTKASTRYMNQRDRQYFRSRLLEWREELLNQLDSTVAHIQYDTANYPDDADRASREEGFGLELRTRGREKKLIEKIDHTMQLIDIGEYGYCEECGTEIGLDRLAARLTATLCIDCKNIAEIRERQRAKD